MLIASAPPAPAGHRGGRGVRTSRRAGRPCRLPLTVAAIGPSVVRRLTPRWRSVTAIFSAGGGAFGLGLLVHAGGRSAPRPSAARRCRPRITRLPGVGQLRQPEAAGGDTGNSAAIAARLALSPPQRERACGRSVRRRTPRRARACRAASRRLSDRQRNVSAARLAAAGRPRAGQPTRPVRGLCGGACRPRPPPPRSGVNSRLHESAWPTPYWELCYRSWVARRAGVFALLPAWLEAPGCGGSAGGGEAARPCPRGRGKRMGLLRCRAVLLRPGAMPRRPQGRSARRESWPRECRRATRPIPYFISEVAWSAASRRELAREGALVGKLKPVRRPWGRPIRRRPGCLEGTFSVTSQPGWRVSWVHERLIHGPARASSFCRRSFPGRRRPRPTGGEKK